VEGKHPAAPGGDDAKPEKTIPIWEFGKQNKWNGYTQWESMGNFLSKVYLLVPCNFNHSESSV